MRLYKRGKTYYVEIKRGVSRSLKTGDKRTAQSLFNEIKQELLHQNIEFLSKKDSCTLLEFEELYKKHPDRVNLSHHSHRADHTAIKSFIESAGNLNLTSITSKHILKFKTDCQSRGLTFSAINTYLRHLQAAFNFAKKEKLMPTPPEIILLKTPTSLPRVIAPDDIKKILEYSKEHNYEMYRIIVFALYTGCRREEIIKLRYEHIKDGCIEVHGKGNKTRIVPLIDKVFEVIDSKQELADIFTYKHYSTISKYFRQIVKACGINARFHDLRHTAATQMISSGISIEVVREILGHVDLKTTQIYAKVVADKIKAEMQKLKYN